MAFDCFMKISGVDGESQDTKYPKWIEVLSFHWGVSQVGTSGAGQGSAGGKANVQDFSIVKKIDAATATIFMHCCTGEHFDKVEVVMRKAGGKGGQVEFLKYEFTQVIIASVRPGGSAQGADDIPLEEVSMNFGKCSFDYTIQNEKGGKGASYHGGWDMMKNVPV